MLVEDGCVSMAVEAPPKPRIRYDPDHDILYMLFEEGPVDDTVEIAEDVFAEVKDGRIVGIEIWGAERIAEAMASAIADKLRVLLGKASKKEG